MYVVEYATSKHMVRCVINVEIDTNPTVTNTYIKLHQNVIQRLHPHGLLRVTFVIFPLVNHDAIIPAISFGNYKMSHTIVIINAIVNNVSTILIYCLIFYKHLPQSYIHKCVKLLIFLQRLFHHINCRGKILPDRLTSSAGIFSPF